MVTRRKDDPVIVVIEEKIDLIHARLDHLESISESLHRIEEWISTVVKVTRIMEVIAEFVTRWAVRLGKLAAATAAVWLCIKGCAADVKALLIR